MLNPASECSLFHRLSNSTKAGISDAWAWAILNTAAAVTGAVRTTKLFIIPPFHCAREADGTDVLYMIKIVNLWRGGIHLSTNFGQRGACRSRQARLIELAISIGTFVGLMIS